MTKGQIAEIYRETLGSSEAESVALAKETKGYAFAFQLLGSLLFKSGKKALDEKVLREFDAIIRDRAYAAIYKELTPKEREILLCVCKDGQDTNAALMELLNTKKGTLSSYKKGLPMRGSSTLTQEAESIRIASVCRMPTLYCNI